MIAPVSSDMASRAACRGFIPCSILIITASTTTMASSTTKPAAKVQANRVKVFSSNPKAFNPAMAPIKATGIAIAGIKVARQSCKNTKITSTTKAMAIIRVIATS